MLLTIEGYSGYTNLLDLVGMIIMFVVIIIACYFVTRFIGSRQIKAQKKSNFKVIDVMRLQGGKLLEIVAIGNRFFVISVSKDSINMIAEIKEEDITFRPDKQINSNLSFKSVLEDVKEKMLIGKRNGGNK